jgi:hypothetical protein
MVSNANLARLEHSLEKLKERENLPVSDADLAVLRSAAKEKAE